MNSIVRKHPLGTAAIIVLVGGLALVTLLYITIPSTRQHRLIWFPDTAGAGFHAEWRTVPYRGERTAEISLYVEEMILGPVELGAIRIVPRGTEAKSIILSDDQTLYLDFNRGILMDDSDATASLEDRLAILTRNIHHNFRFVHAIVVTIEGQLPNQPRFARVGR